MPNPPLIPDLAQQAPSGPLLLAFSGGLDSSVLLHLLVSVGLGPRLRVVHINHQLQKNSSQWAAHCEQVAGDLSVSCQVIPVQVETGRGVEAGARQARYQALFADARRDGATLITAHHRDDQAETLLLRLLRGAGVQGLAAMRPLDHRQGVAVWRPLLEQPRSVLERYAREQGLRWQEDPSNQDQSLRRNHLRHSILPALRRRWQGTEEVLARTARHMAEASELLDERAAEDARSCGVDGQRFPLTGLSALRPARQRNLLRWWLQDQGASAPSAAVLDQALALQDAAEDSQARVEWGRWAVRLYRGALYVLPRQAQAPWQGELSWPQGSPPPSLPLWQLVSTGVDEGIRLWRPPGDLVLRPFTGGERLLRNGMHQRIKELWRAAGVPPWQRRQWPLLYRGETLVSVPLLGLADGEEKAHCQEWFLLPRHRGGG
ncbi:MAG: tRNA lysidine(34) synthetase TilS [Pseudomonadales bacterium]|nr:tRNA lysidine(34) synthetase TilS [Pseudomonadales bacterium]